MKPKSTLLALSLLAVTTRAGEPAPDAWSRFDQANNWDLGGILYPNLYLHGVGGSTSGDAEDLSPGGHGPVRQAFSAQAIEPGLSLRTEWLQAFANHVFWQDDHGHWDNEWEEAFAKWTHLPAGLEIKGGQFLSHFGSTNHIHLHGRDFVEGELASGRFLGEDGLILRGAELGWTLPLGLDPVWTVVANLGFGDVRPHDHGHGPAAPPTPADPPHEGEESVLEEDVWTGRLAARYRFSDFHSLTGGWSLAQGRNGYDRHSTVQALDLEYLWRENGLLPGGKALRWRNEIFWRSADAFSEYDDDNDGAIDRSYFGTYREWGAHSHLIYTWNPRLDTALRLGWVEGIDDFGQDERFRISPALAWWADEARRIGFRLQYNFDSIASARDEHSLWFQINLALGSNVEVR